MTTWSEAKAELEAAEKMVTETFEIGLTRTGKDGKSVHMRGVGPEYAAASKKYFATVRALLSAGEQLVKSGAATADDENYVAAASDRCPSGCAMAWR